MLTKPVDRVAAPDPVSREIKDQVFLVIDGGADLGAVEDEERLHGGVPSTLVAIDTRVAAMQFDDLAECEIPHQARRPARGRTGRLRGGAVLPAMAKDRR